MRIEGQEAIALHEDIIRLNQENENLRDEVVKWQLICVKMLDVTERMATLLQETLEGQNEYLA